MSFTKESYGPWSVVLGASMGIGEAIARYIASKGVSVVVVARSKDKLDKLASEIEQSCHVQARAVALDLMEDDAWDKLAEAIADIEVGSAVYSAAYAFVGGFLAIDDDLEERIIKLNVQGSLKFSHFFGELFCRQERGGMLYLGSLSGYYSTPYMALYSATKGFEIMLAESLYGEFKHLNVDVTVGLIGSVDTPGLKGLYPDEKAYSALKAADPALIGQMCVDALGEGPTAIVPKDAAHAVGMLRRAMSLNRQIDLIGDQTVNTGYRGKLPLTVSGGLNYRRRAENSAEEGAETQTLPHYDRGRCRRAHRCRRRDVGLARAAQLLRDGMPPVDERLRSDIRQQRRGCRRQQVGKQRVRYRRDAGRHAQAGRPRLPRLPRAHISQQVCELATTITGSYEVPLAEENVEELMVNSGNEEGSGEQFCLRAGCHDMTAADLEAADADLSFNIHLELRRNAGKPHES